MATLAAFLLTTSWRPSWTWRLPVNLAIPMDRDDNPVTLYSNLVEKGDSVKGENPVSHEKIVARLVPLPFEYQGKTYVQANTQTTFYNYGGVYCSVTYEVRCSRSSIQFTSTIKPVDPSQKLYGQFAWDVQRTETYLPDEINPRSGRVRVLSVSSEQTDVQAYPPFSSEGWLVYTAQTCAVDYPTFAALELWKGFEDRNPEPVGVESDLIVEAANSLKLSANNIANAMDFADVSFSMARFLLSSPKQKLRQIASSAKKLRSPRVLGRVLKDTAQNAWLSYRYVYSTTKSDYDDFVSKFNRLERYANGETRRIARSGSRVNNWEYHVKIAMHDHKQFATAEAHRRAMLTGTAITPYNIWDMVPFSFMVDWFLPVGENLEKLDAEFFFHNKAYFGIDSYTFSRKCRETILLDQCEITFTKYTRTVSSSVPIIGESQTREPSIGTSVKRVLDASAIFID